MKRDMVFVFWAFRGSGVQGLRAQGSGVRSSGVEGAEMYARLIAGVFGPLNELPNIGTLVDTGLSMLGHSSADDLIGGEGETSLKLLAVTKRRVLSRHPRMATKTASRRLRQ